MPEDKRDDSGFKVVDRRPFSVDGTRREDAPPQYEEAREKAHEKTDSHPTATATSAARSPVEPEEYFEPEGSGFETLVSYLSTTAMFQLGLLPDPAGERIPADLSNAHRTIDLLEILQQKTRGNLTPDESKLLDDVLYELRLSFVEIEKRGAPKRK